MRYDRADPEETLAAVRAIWSPHTGLTYSLTVEPTCSMRPPASERSLGC